MKDRWSRREVVSAFALAGSAAALHPVGFAQSGVGVATPSSPIKLGIASYTFRNFDRAQLIEEREGIRVHG